MEPEPVSRAKINKMAFLVALVTLFVMGTLLFVSFAYFGGNFKEEQKQALEQTSKNDMATSSFSLETRFPDSSQFSVKPDPTDRDKLLIGSADGIVVFDTKSGGYDKYGINELVPGLMMGNFVRVEQNLIFENRGTGIGVYDMTQKKVKMYTKAEGLVDESNIRFHPDPHDKNIVWIGTFRGLSRFNIQEGTFKNYTKEMGVVGSQWEPNVFYIDDKEVWVAVHANVYSQGGVARLNKTTDTWTAWSVETFTQGQEENLRLDPIYVTVGNANHIVISEDNVEYNFDRNLEKWTVVKNESPTVVNLGVNIAGDWLYEKRGDTLHAYNLVTTEVASLNYLEMFSQATDTRLFSTEFIFDQNHNRYLAIPLGGELQRYPYVLELQIINGKLVDKRFLSVEGYFKQFPYTDVKILDTEGGELLFKEDDDLFLYDIETKEIIFSWDYKEHWGEGWDIKAKLYPNKVAVHVADYCEGMCFTDNEYTSTTTIFDRATGKAELALPFFDSEGGWEMYWDKTEVGGALQGWGSDKAYTLDVVSRKFEPAVHNPELEPAYKSPEEVMSVEGSDTLKYRSKTNEERELLTIITASSSGREELYQVHLSEKINPFGIREQFSVYKAISNPPYAWFATDRGIVRFDENEKKSRVYTVSDGLRLNANDMYYTGNWFVVSNAFGIEIYKYNNI